MTGRLRPAGVTGKAVVVRSAPGVLKRRQQRALLVRAAAWSVDALLWTATLAWQHSGSHGWATLCGLPALALFLCLAASTLLHRTLVAVTVHGDSMQPTYRHGDRVLVRRGSSFERGRTVVVEQPDRSGAWTRRPLPRAAGAAAVSGRRWLIKRVAAVPGDPVPRDLVPALAEALEDHVPAGRLVLLGDNTEASHDSRQIGYFPAERVLGVVRSERTEGCALGRPA